MNVVKKIIYIDMDDVIFNFTKAHDKAIDKVHGIIYPQSQLDFFRKLEPLENAIESVNELMKSDYYDVYFLTAPSLFNPLCYTEKCLSIKDYFGQAGVNKLIISPNKALLRGDYLIDDRIIGRGQDKFQGNLIHFGSTIFPNWDTVLYFLSNDIDKK